jgi:cytochrome c-type biogenesis protein CcmH/NrfG
LAVLAEEHGDNAGAVERWQAVLAQFPHDTEARTVLERRQA